MKRGFCIFLLLLMLPAMLGGCRSETREITCEEVIAAYEQAGYDVAHRDYPEQEYGYLCEITIEDEDGDSLRFHFYGTADEAKAEAKEREWNGLLWLFSAIYGDPTWLESESYRNIQIEYTDDDLIKPFRELTKK